MCVPHPPDANAAFTTTFPACTTLLLAPLPEIALDFLVRVREARPAVFVGNANVAPELMYALFGKDVVHVKVCI